MKIIVHTVLALIYWVGSMGAQVSLHWCAGDLENIQWFGLEEHSCCATKQDKLVSQENSKNCCTKTIQEKKPCCQDVTLKAEIKDEHQLSQLKFSFYTPFLVERTLIPSILEQNSILQEKKHLIVVFTTGPPLYLQYRQLRIGNTHQV